MSVIIQLSIPELNLLIIGAQFCILFLTILMLYFLECFIFHELFKLSLHCKAVICVKVWNVKDERQLLIEWIVFFSGLVFLGEQVRLC